MKNNDEIEIDWKETFFRITELLPEANFWFKDRAGKFIMANNNFLEMSRQKSREVLFSKTDYDVWPPHLTEVYVEGDKHVMDTGGEIIGQLELMKASDGSTNWFSTTKIPVYNKNKEVVAVGGFTLNLKKTDANLKVILSMSPVIDYMMAHYSEKIEIKDLAYLVGLSSRAFERNFKKNFNMTPMKYLNRIRLEAATELLVTTDKSISEIGLDTGFYDQGHFSRHFHKYSGKYPSQYRKDNALG